MNERQALMSLWNACHARGTLTALATVCEVKGSAYRQPGARMLLCEDGQSAGVISGGCLDADLWRRAREVIGHQQPQLACYDTTASQDIVWGLGLGCRGVVKILIEPIESLDFLRDGQTAEARFEGEPLGTVALDCVLDFPSPRILENAAGRALVQTFQSAPPLWIFGAGADAIPLVFLAQNFGWNAQVFDPRAPHPDRRPLLPARYLPSEALEELDATRRTACVVMTHNFGHDAEILRALLPSAAFYLGLLGPRRRADELLAFLAKGGFTPTSEQLQKLHAPVGLDIGAETPAEIALSIVAELRAVTGARGGGFLRARGASIHGEVTI